MSITRRTFTGLSAAAISGGLAAPGLAVAAAKAGPASPSGRKGLTVPEHFVPTPTTISPEAQAFLNQQSPFDGPKIPDSLDDAEGWKAFREASDAGIIAFGKARAAQFPAEVTEAKMPNCKIYQIVPENLAPENEKRAILYVHGGGFMIGGGEAAVLSAQVMAGKARTRVFVPDYRMVPEVAFPEPMLDVVDAYYYVLQRYDGDKIAFFGASAGANLAPAAILKARSIRWPLPAACALHSVPSDMSGNGDTEYTNVVVDTVLKDRDPRMASNYAGGHDPKDPFLSPVYGDFSEGFSPTLLTSGTRDILLSGTVRLHRALVRAGVDAHLHVWEAMPHAPFIGSPEEEEVNQAHIHFMLSHMA